MRIKRFKSDSRNRIDSYLQGKDLVIFNKHGVIHDLNDPCKILAAASMKDVVHITIAQYFVYDLPYCTRCFPYLG